MTLGQLSKLTCQKQEVKQKTEPEVKGGAVKIETTGRGMGKRKTHTMEVKFKILFIF